MSRQTGGLSLKSGQPVLARRPYTVFAALQPEHGGVHPARRKKGAADVGVRDDGGLVCRLFCRKTETPAIS